MSVDIRFPNITGKSDSEQLTQVKSYLHQLVEQLNWALSTVDGAASGTAKNVSLSSGSVTGTGKVDAQATFNSIKSLIIKSADIVNAYYDVINTRLEGVYVAESDFGAYAEQTTNDIKATSDSISQLYSNIQTILTDIENVENTLIEVNAYINSGLLYYDENGVPVYGLEIGQRNEIDGEEVFNKYAQFVADKLSFYDQNGNEVAYISDYKLYITHAEITGTLTLGAFRIETTRGFTLKYVGRG